jgi:hypothetical protein
MDNNGMGPVSNYGIVSGRVLKCIKLFVEVGLLLGVE